ncbi:MAG: inositol monophosphatase [Candidatus Omnitrophica bacterium]|nr:inositol monophosphatase [Candidatus Omnitrophota bacterium]
MSEIINLSIKAAKEAGKFLLENFGKIKEIESKGDRNLVTNVDKEAERIIVDNIKSKFSSHDILGEEGGRSNLKSDYLWIIDPLDGTHNFIRGINIFGVSIGVVYKDKFVAGTIYMPVDDELYVAEERNGAYKDGKKIYVSGEDNLKRCSISFDSSIRYSPNRMLKVLGELAKEVFNVRMFGSSARVLSYIAEGKIDFAVEFYDQPWDFAAGVCLIEEAGGKFTNLKGEYPTQNTVGYIASNQVVYDSIYNIVAKVLEER